MIVHVFIYFIVLCIKIHIQSLITLMIRILVMFKTRYPHNFFLFELLRKRCQKKILSIVGVELRYS